MFTISSINVHHYLMKSVLLSTLSTDEDTEAQRAYFGQVVARTRNLAQPSGSRAQAPNLDTLLTSIS